MEFQSSVSIVLKFVCLALYAPSLHSIFINGLFVNRNTLSIVSHTEQYAHDFSEMLKNCTCKNKKKSVSEIEINRERETVTSKMKKM